MKLYHCKGARSVRALWTLEEMGLEYELHTMPFPPRVFEREYLEINPLGTIPFLMDGDVKMTESCAIPMYLTEKYGPSDLALKPDHPDYAAYLNFICHADATLTFPQTVYIRYALQEPKEDGSPQDAAIGYRKWFVARTRWVEAHLEGKDFLVADRFTIADICVSYAFQLAESLGFEEAFKPNIKRYWEGLKERPAFQRMDHGDGI